MDPMMKWTIKMYQAMMMSKPMFVSMSMRIPPDWLMSVMYPEDLIWSPCTTLLLIVVADPDVFFSGYYYLPLYLNLFIDKTLFNFHQIKTIKLKLRYSRFSDKAMSTSLTYRSFIDQ